LDQREDANPAETVASRRALAYITVAITGIILWITGAIDIACAFIAGVILQKVTLRFGGKYRSWFLTRIIHEGC